MSSIHIGESLQLHKPTNDTVTNPLYHTLPDDHCNKPARKVISYYEEMDILPEVN